MKRRLTRKNSAQKKLGIAGFLGVAAVLSASVFFLSDQGQAAAKQKADNQKPNVIVIMADDLGYTDVSTYGNFRLFQTPYIDQIAKDGVLFTQGYVTAPICAPSRAGLMTGRYQNRFGFEYLDQPKMRAQGVSYGIAPSEQTLADALRSSGYHTGLIGKWHLGSEKGFYPTDRGFDEFYGWLSGSTPYIDQTRPDVVFFDLSAQEAAVNANRTDKEKPPVKDWTRRKGEEVVLSGAERTLVDNMDVYLTDDLAEKASSFITRNKSAPFFLYLSFSAPHVPLQVTRKYYDRFGHIKDEKTRIYAAMISALDDGVGRVLTTLKDQGLDENTIVIFISDNGCNGQAGVCLCEPLNGVKQSHYEGGMRVPYMMRWPARLKPGQVYDKPVSVLDIFPTAVMASGQSFKSGNPLDGVDLLPYLQRVKGKTVKNELPHPELYWLRRPQATIIHDGFKLWVSDDDQVKLLFDLKNDPGEKQNLYTARPEKVAELNQRLTGFREQMPEPLWPSPAVKMNFCGQTMTLPY